MLKLRKQLMRARYSAYTKVATDFIFQSTHPDHRKGYDHEGTRVLGGNVRVAKPRNHRHREGRPGRQRWRG